SLERPETLARRRRLLESLAELSQRRSPEAVVTARDEELGVLLPPRDDPPDPGPAAGPPTAAPVPARRLAVGAGGPSGSASAIARSYAQSRRALETAHRFGNQGDVIVFEDLGLYRLLFHVSDASELRGFTDHVLGQLVEYDQRHNADFVRTLEAFL